MYRTVVHGPRAFDNDRYLAEQTEAILQRVSRFDKLYLEFGGKLLFDYHAARVLPGFDPNVKMRMLQKIRDQAEILICIHAGDIERRKVRADFGITYDSDAFKLIDDLREWELLVRAVVITRFQDQPAAIAFRERLERRGVPVYTHRPIADYAANVDRTVSDAGYGANPWIATERPLVVVTAPGPNSGKLGTCLSQVYHEHRRGNRAGYAKFETFPIWNLPLRHPVNVAYEAATADLGDVNVIDPFHLEAYGVTAVNYNRDVEAFPLLRRILERISGDRSLYQSPTDMGVNRAGFAIIDDDAARTAAREEIRRRYYRYACDHANGNGSQEAVQRLERLLQEHDIDPEDRAVVREAHRTADEAQVAGVKGHRGVFVGAAIQLPDGTLVTGRNSPVMHAASALVLNAAKRLAGLPDRLDLLSPSVMESIGSLKRQVFGGDFPSLSLDETLIALSISATTNPAAGLAMEQLPRLRGCEVHLTHIPGPGDEKALRRLGVNLTSVPSFETNKLFVS
ncbi:MAG TPA: DUF1846 domain-containing protein [Myxococcota bacterium]|nr:DUF1846 domain-containing protein [Myxococcota bacterium]HQK50180.1 DUF1846 domain-containing protein [Myxococcota bacterium]